MPRDESYLRPGPAKLRGVELARIGADLHRLSRRYRHLLSRISRIEELADAIGLQIAVLEEGFEALGSEADPGRATPEELATRGVRDSRPGATTRSVGAGAKALRALRAAARCGVSSLDVDRRADGSAVVKVDRGAPFVLPPMLADLLDVLALDSGRAGDGLVGWKTLAEVAVLLGKRVGRKVTKRAVTQNVYRLRRRLFEEGGVNPHLVQSNRRSGLRFALRSKEAPGVGVPRPTAGGWGDPISRRKEGS